MPSLCGSAEATRKWFRAFTAHSFLACRPLRPRGVRHRYPELRCRYRLRRLTNGSALPTLPQSVPRGRSISWLHWFASATACQVARPPVRIRPDRPAFGDFYFQAFNGSVSLSVAGYNYNSDWTPLLAGLSPAGMAASLAARSTAALKPRNTTSGSTPTADMRRLRRHVSSVRTTAGGRLFSPVIIRFRQILIERHQKVLRTAKFSGECSGCDGHLRS